MSGQHVKEDRQSENSLCHTFGIHTPVFFIAKYLGGCFSFNCKGLFFFSISLKQKLNTLIKMTMELLGFHLKDERAGK